MMYYHNALCPVCKQPLAEGDDVVVCPECGAPYHRACYKKAGHCLYEDKHAEGFSYLPPKAQSEGESGRFVICPHCHKGNPATSAVCSNCGTSLQGLPTIQLPDDAAAEGPNDEDRQPDTAARADVPPAYRRTRQQASPDTGKFRPLDGGSIWPRPEDDADDDPAANPLLQMLGSTDLNEELDGFTLKEWLSYLGPSGPLYLFQFRQMDTNRTGHSFSLSAMLFAPVYFLYRKMWGWGVLALLCELLCAAPSVLLVLHSIGAVGALPFAMSMAALQRLTLIGTYLSLAMDMFWGFAAYRLYRRQCVRGMYITREGVRRFNDDHPQPDVGKLLLSQLAKRGGVSLAGGCAGLLSYLPTLLILFL